MGRRLWFYWCKRCAQIRLGRPIRRPRVTVWRVVFRVGWGIRLRRGIFGSIRPGAYAACRIAFVQMLVDTVPLPLLIGFHRTLCCPNTVRIRFWRFFVCLTLVYLPLFFEIRSVPVLPTHRVRTRRPKWRKRQKA